MDKRLLLLVPLGLVLACMAWPDLNAALGYDRQAVGQGQWWRLASASFTHVGPLHAALNLGALALLAAWLRADASPVAFFAGLLVAGLGVFVAEHWLGTAARAFGLSGPLHALGAVATLTCLTGKERVLGVLLFVGKLLEEAVAPGSGAGGLIGAPVLASHHLYGAALGVLAVFLSSHCSPFVRMLHITRNNSFAHYA